MQRVARVDLVDVDGGRARRDVPHGGRVVGRVRDAVEVAVRDADDDLVVAVAVEVARDRLADGVAQIDRPAPIERARVERVEVAVARSGEHAGVAAPIDGRDADDVAEAPAPRAVRDGARRERVAVGERAVRQLGSVARADGPEVGAAERAADERGLAAATHLRGERVERHHGLPRPAHDAGAIPEPCRLVARVRVDLERRVSVDRGEHHAAARHEGRLRAHVAAVAAVADEHAVDRARDVVELVARELADRVQAVVADAPAEHARSGRAP
ncbi:MAG: hypothetical protein M5U28_14930 [Sandaracinaceae bacterium]|nr:hypothetical protein [Sandaracinaceae bacterium]